MWAEDFIFELIHDTEDFRRFVFGIRYIVETDTVAGITNNKKLDEMLSAAAAIETETLRDMAEDLEEYAYNVLELEPRRWIWMGGKQTYIPSPN